MIGRAIGHYQIVGKLGEGGMGEVYRARDARLHRDVAIKILRQDDARDQERLQRFVREAQTLAALNHPHIAQLYGIEDDAIVMELVEGEDLSARLAQGALPIDEAIAIATQIAQALESAHDLGIIHRDLKPANVKVRADGTVKVLDFGLAKALDPAGRSGGSSGSGRGEFLDVATITSPATAAGMILGTAAYMAPEQARGKPVDRRADIWAFGVVLYEMLTGSRAFAGDTATDVLAAVVTREPNWQALPPATPPRVREILRRCLEKDHRLRLRDIGEARIALTAPSEPRPSSPAATRTFSPGRVLPWAVAAVAILAAVATWIRRPAADAPLRKIELTLPGDALSPTLSPDGRAVAYLARGRVWVRDLSALQPRDLAPAVSTRSVTIWSPDSSLIGYNTQDGRLWVVPAAGGTPLSVCTIPETAQLMGATWRRNGTIVLAVWRGSLYEVAATGGELRPLLAPATGKEVDWHQPRELSDGRLLVLTHHVPGDNGVTNYSFEIVDGTRRETLLTQPGITPVAEVEPGHLLFTRSDANTGLWALPFSRRDPLRIADAVLIAPGANPVVDYAPSVDTRDSLLYALPPTGLQLRELVWVDRSGRVTGQVGTAGEMQSPALSPDSTRVAFSARRDTSHDIWVRHIASGADMRASFDALDEAWPTWFATGRRLAYAVTTGTALGDRMVARDVGGTSQPADLGDAIGGNFSRDGKYFAFYVDDRGRNRIRYAAVDAQGNVGSPTPLFKSADEPDALGPTFSPDGQLMAYVERQPSGNMEIFVTRFPSGEGRLQVSSGGGRAAVWAANGELFYLDGSTNGVKHMTAVRITGTDTLRASVPETLFEIGEEFYASFPRPHFDVTPDGKQLLMLRRSAHAGPAMRWVLVQNWRSEFTQLRR